MEDILERLNEQFKSALVFEDKFSKFNALSEFAKETNSADIPEFLKQRMLKSASEQQMSLVGLMDIKINSLSPCFAV